MRSFPTVNWWRGNLRLYESRISLVTRFARLNRLTVQQCECYFDGALGEDRDPSPAAIEKMANFLDEDIVTLQETLVPSIDLPKVGDSIERQNKLTKAVRYCPECALLGYHSYLHERPWLSHCPFHRVPLKIAHAQLHQGSNYVRRCGVLAQVMTDACSSWPSAPHAKFDLHKRESFAWLCTWMGRLATASVIFSVPRLWSSSAQLFSKPTTDGHIIGRLHALEPIPCKMKSLFHAIEEGWTAHIKHFSLRAKEDFLKAAELGVLMLYMLYQRVATSSSLSRNFALLRDLCAEMLLSSHAVCRCQWGRERTAFGFHWVRVYPDDWPRWNLTCPYAVAKEQFEAATGRRPEGQTRRSQEEDMNLIIHAQPFLERGLIALAPNVKPPWEGRLYMPPQTWPPFEWVGTPSLNAVLEAAAQSEANALYRSLCEWLDDIGHDERPESYFTPPPAIWISETNEGLALIEWRRSVV